MNHLKIIKDYELQEKIGEGQSSQVYRAVKNGVNYAIKISKEDHADETVVKNFEYEFWVLKNIDHPSFVKVFDYGYLPEGPAYIIEEYLDGDPFETFFQGKSFKECEPLFFELIEAMSLLARWKIIHGDLKPDNLKIIECHGSFHIKFLDFGFALGTPLTIAPEVIEGSKPDLLSEAYSLGVLLYMALAGDNPFVGDHLSETFNRHRFKEPKAIGLVRADIPPAWAEVIAALIRKNKYERPSNFQDILNYLKPAGVVSSLQIKPDQVCKQSFKELASYLIIHRQLKPADTLWDEWQPQNDPDEKIHWYYLKAISHLEIAQFDDALKYFLTAGELLSCLANQTFWKIKIKNYVAYSHLMKGDVEGAQKEFEFLRNEINETLSSDEKKQITNFDLGLVYKELGRWVEAKALIEAEISQHESTLQASSLSDEFVYLCKGRLSNLYYQWAQCLVHFNLFGEADKAFNEGLVYAELVGDLALMLRLQNGLGNLYRQTNDSIRAFKAYEKALEMARALQDYRSLATLFYNQGLLYKENNEREKALECFDKAILFVEKIKYLYAFEKIIRIRSLIEKGFLQQNHDCFNLAWAYSEKDDSIQNIRFWVLKNRVLFFKSLGDDKNLEKDLLLLPYYARTEEEKKFLKDLQASIERSITDESSKNNLGQKEMVRVPDQVKKILEINQDLLSQMSFEQFIKRLLLHAINLSEAELAVILKVLDDGRFLPLQSHNAALDEALSEISMGVSHRVLKTGEMVIADDVVHDQNLNQYTSIVALNLKSVVGIPIPYQGRIWGILYLSTQNRLLKCDEALKETLKLFASQVGLALKFQELVNQLQAENLSMNDKLGQWAKQLEQQERELNTYRVASKGSMATSSPVMERIMEEALLVAGSHIPIVIQGETGTGKEVMARFIQAHSGQADGPFIAINCGAIPATLVESELFGVKKGSFTGADRDKPGLIEMAHQGTLFLDEIVDLPFDVQVKLLRVLQEKEVMRVGEVHPKKIDVRIICASHQNLAAAVSEKKFREDLYYRLSGYEITLPALRDRVEDIPLLANIFLDEVKKENPRIKSEQYDPQLLGMLMQYDWPGNIRELKQFVAVSALFGMRKLLTYADLPAQLKTRLKDIDQTTSAIDHTQSKIYFHKGWPWQLHLNAFIAGALDYFDDDAALASGALGLSIATLYNWMRKNNYKNQKSVIQKMGYQKGLTLDAFQKRVFGEVARKYPGEPYKGAGILQVSPVTYYKWIS
ncbi:MAG: NifA subfamily transcriptional regulator [uncultured bacterium]|nr:MAG: NifA subfamily transcriptional regulator [uncultured bacterium]